MKKMYEPYKMLVVEDDRDLRETMVYSMKKKGFDVSEASSGHLALEILKTVPVDIVISDIRMPDGDGVELLKSIREVHPNIPVVILVSGFSDFTRDQVLSLGALDLLDKPVSPKTLTDSLDEAKRLVQETKGKAVVGE